MSSTDLAGDARVAVYYAPAATDPLWGAGSAWLGRDAATGAATPQPAVDQLAALTRRPCGYGFHATLKAPFRLRHGAGWNDVAAALRAAVAPFAAFPLPVLHVGVMDSYLALLERAPDPVLAGLADAMVVQLDTLRAPLDERELARRRVGGLSAGQELMLQRWGYPDVLATWRFHMTLSDRLSPAQIAACRPAAERFFDAACAVPRVVRDVCLFVQPGYRQPFRLIERVPLGG